MPRGPRILPLEGTFHLIARSNNGEMLCRFPRDYETLKRRLCRFFSSEKISVYHYCLMRTHFHALAMIPDTRALPHVMKALQLSYFHHYRRMYAYRGHLWNSRYRCILIRKEPHLIQCGRYIELNPVYARIVQGPERYRWSSFAYYGLGREDFLVTPNPHLTVVSSDSNTTQTAYRQFVLDGMDLEYQSLKKAFEGKEMR